MPSAAFTKESGLKDYYVLPGILMSKEFFYE